MIPPTSPFTVQPIVKPIIIIIAKPKNIHHFAPTISLDSPNLATYSSKARASNSLRTQVLPPLHNSCKSNLMVRSVCLNEDTQLKDPKPWPTFFYIAIIETFPNLSSHCRLSYDKFTLGKRHILSLQLWPRKWMGCALPCELVVHLATWHATVFWWSFRSVNTMYPWNTFLRSVHLFHTNILVIYICLM